MAHHGDVFLVMLSVIVSISRYNSSKVSNMIGGAKKIQARDTSLSKLRDESKNESKKVEASAYNIRQSEIKCSYASQYKEKDESSIEDSCSDGESSV